MNNQSCSDKLDYLLYKKTAKIYDNQRFTGRAGGWGHSRQIAILNNMVPDWQEKEVLEIGCGTGRITEALARWGAKVTATDINAEMIGIAEERFKRNQDLAISGFREMSVYNIDMDLKRFDYVIMVNVWGHLSKSYEAIYNIASNVSSRCKLIFTFPCLTSVLLPFGLIVNIRRKSLSHEVTSHWYLPGTVEKYCNAAELKIIGWYGNHYVPQPRLLFPTLPLFKIYESILAKYFPKRCPSVFVACKLKSGNNN